MIVSIQITNIKLFAFRAILVLKLLSHRILFITEKTTETVKNRLAFKKITAKSNMVDM